MISDNTLALDLKALGELDDFGLLVELDANRATQVAREVRQMVDREVTRAMRAEAARDRAKARTAIRTTTAAAA